MNAVKEYTILIKRGIYNIDKVLAGFVNNIRHKYNLLSIDKIKVMTKRIEICKNCPYNSINAQTSFEYKTLTGMHYFSVRPKVHCSLCGCKLDYKVQSLRSNCGIEVWNEENKQNQLELKWTRYQK